MDAKEVAFQIAKVDRMLERVDKVCGRERDPKPLRPDVSYPRRAPKKVYRPTTQPMSRNSTRDAQSVGYSQVVASGELAGNEMRLSDYRPQPRDDDPGGIWAAFESDFDDMVAGMH